MLSPCRRRIALAAALLRVVCGSSVAPQVTIPGLGAVQGVANGIANEFRAIPYSAAPARFAQPDAPPAAWAPAVLDGTVDPPGCMQICEEPPGVCPTRQSEDCLFLNIFTPLSAASSSSPSSPLSALPVLVYIHGGNFRDGFAGGLLYNGSHLAADGAVVVALSYRLGVFGFLYGGEGGALPPGNLGLADQRAALRWVRAHISAFGGDAARVTVFGQSAGAQSVAAHMISPASAGLFDAAFSMSEPFDLPFRTRASALDAFAAVAAAAGCGGDAAAASACLRALPAAALLAAQAAAQKNLTADSVNLLQAFEPFCPTVGLPELPNWPLYSFQGLPGAAPVADVPYLASTTSGEGFLFIYAAFGGNISSALEYALLLEVFFGPAAAPRIAAQYPVPAPPPADLRPLVSNVTTDAIFACATRNATRALAAQSGRRAPVYLARFSRLLTWAPSLWTNVSKICWTQVCHGADLAFWWRPDDPPRSQWQPDELRLSAAMRAYLVAFAASRGASMGTGAPGAPPVAWPAIDAATGAAPAMLLDLPAWRVADLAGDEACALFDQIGYSNDGAWGA